MSIKEVDKSVPTSLTREVIDKCIHEKRGHNIRQFLFSSRVKSFLQPLLLSKHLRPYERKFFTNELRVIENLSICAVRNWILID